MLFDLTECEQAIGYTFKDKNLLRQCFTFKSYANENHGGKDNERLEYLGDAILGFVVAEYLYKTYSYDEGKLTEMRINLVSKTPLQNAVKKYGYDSFMLIGVGAKKDLHGNEKLFSSLFECIVAGIYLDGGLEQARKFILAKLVTKKGDKKAENKKVAVKNLATKDIKSTLQEYVQKHKLGSIEYKDVKKSGPDHEPTFEVACYINGSKKGTGKGHSKKEAQSNSATTAFAKLTKNNSVRSK